MTRNCVFEPSGGPHLMRAAGAPWKVCAATWPSVSSRPGGRGNVAPRARIYDALIDAEAISKWKVPVGMTMQVHAFEAREGGRFRISLKHDAPTGTDKTTAHTDTYHGHFVKLVPNQQVVDVIEFETEDPALRGEMTTTITLVDAGDGTEVLAVHDGVPPGISPADNEAGWQMAFDRLAALVEVE